MRHEELLDVNCAICRTSGVLGERWVFAILRSAFLRARTFEDYQRMTGVARNILTERLNRLVDFGILERRPYEEHANRVRSEYRLTDAGKDLYPVIVAIMDWGNKHTGLIHGPPVELVHRGCGATVMPHMTCPECGQPIGATDMTPKAGPGASADQVAAEDGPGGRLRTGVRPEGELPTDAGPGRARGWGPDCRAGS